jgi:hypothetical protein
MIRILDNSYTDYEKRCLISLWHIMIQERDIHCKCRSVGCDKCAMKRLCVDLDASYEWMEKNYDKD